MGKKIKSVALMKTFRWEPFIIIVFSLFQIRNAVAVTSVFERTLGGTGYDEPISVIQSLDGGYVISGHTNSFGAGGYDIYVVKLSSSGGVEWTKTIGGINDDFSYSLIQDSDYNYIVAGFTKSFGAGDRDIYIIKLDSSGQIIWTKTIGWSGGDEAFSIIQSSDSGYIVAGWTSFNYDDDFYVVKLDSNGNVIWQKTVVRVGFYDYAVSVLESSDGGYVIAGVSSKIAAPPPFEESLDIYVVKLDRDGNVLWAKTIGGDNFDGSISVIESFDSGYIIAGWTGSFGAGGFDMYLVKLDNLGNLIWTKTIGGILHEIAFTVLHSFDGGFVVAGATGSFGAGDYDMYIVKLDIEGNILWARTIGEFHFERASRLIQSSDGGYVLVGPKLISPTDADFYVVKIAENRKLTCHESYQPFPSIFTGGEAQTPLVVSSSPTLTVSFQFPAVETVNVSSKDICIPTVVTVSIDIKPRSFPNAINLKNKGVVPVAVLGNSQFDVSKISTLSVVFGPGRAKDTDGKASFEDVNGDGIPDAIFHFKTQEIGFSYTDTQGCLEGLTYEGINFSGCDSIKIVP